MFYRISEFYFKNKSQKVRMFHVKHSDFVVCVSVFKKVPAPPLQPIATLKRDAPFR